MSQDTVTRGPAAYGVGHDTVADATEPPGALVTGGLVTGALVLAVGVALPWFSTLAGLNVVRGTSLVWGRVLLALAAAVLALTVAATRRRTVVTRWLLPGLGVTTAAVATVLLAAYLVLLHAFRADALALGRGGAGVPVAAAGAALVAAAALWPRRRVASPYAAEPAAGRTVAAAPLAIPALLAGAGVIHLSVLPEHLSEWWLYAVFFAASGLAQVSLAGWYLLGGPGRRVSLGVAVATLGIVAMWLVTRTSGLPFGPDAGSPEAWGVADVVCSGLEVITAALLLVPLRRRPAMRGLAGGTVVATVALTAWAVLDGAGLLTTAATHLH